MTTKWKPISLLFTLTAGACAGGANPDGEGTPAAGLRMTLTASELPESSPAGAVALEDADGTAFTIEHAEAYIRHIQLDLPQDEHCADLHFEFEPPTTCRNDKIEIAGPFVVDLVAGTSEPALSEVRIPAGVYERVDVRFEDAEADEGLVDASHALAEHTMHATGTAGFEGGAIPFELLLKFNEDARFEATAGVALGASGGTEALLMLDVSRWFEALPLKRCMEEGDLALEEGTLVIDDARSECGDVERTLTDAIKNSGQLQGA